MFFTLADTLYFRFMNGIYLFSAITSLGKNGLKEFEQFPDFITFLRHHIARIENQ